MNYYKMNIQYDGTNYKGFQFQNDLKTIQNELNVGISKITSGKFSTMSASRTDTGVHAFEQVVKLTLEDKINTNDYLNLLNKLLPPEIKILSISKTEWQFKPNSNLYKKDYVYLFQNNKININHPYIANFSPNLSLEKIQNCCRKIIGKRDFKNFTSAGSNVKTTIREVYECKVSIIKPNEYFGVNSLFESQFVNQECFALEISANGFLKQMVRNIVSLSWQTGSHKITEEKFESLLNGEKINQMFWRPAPANGLFLKKIHYT